MSTTYSISLGLQNHMMATGSFVSALSGMVIRIYKADVVPANAGAALGASAVMLCEVNSAALNGLHFNPVPVNGFIYKDSAEVWSGINAASGLGVFYRGVLPGDDGTESTVAPRVQGSVGLLNADMILKYTNLVIGEPQPITSFMANLPSA